MMARLSRRIWISAATVAAAVTIGSVVGGAWWLGRGVFDPQWNLTLADVMESKSGGADAKTEPTNVTSSVCDETVRCIEAYDTAEALYLRFDTRAGAAKHESTIADGFQSNYVVMDFAGKNGVTKTKQLWAMQHLAGMWQDYVGDFPDR
ncbi:hypothetical protein [Agromyces luteolus]|uniref:Uncharacterized protein n=1 Tax=Agromyces luteolus TaxID=88373 RepID=A0A7C9LGY5_9MICO|nr:hypothetical protein [Agromyces luteolus]MUN06854.1 hypothetical protein [Agromyces luteolus]